MELNTENTTSSIFEEVTQLLSENSETIETLSVDNENQSPPLVRNQEWSLGQAPIKTSDDPNFEIYKQAAEEGSNTALIDASNNSQNIQTAVNMLLRAPEFKQFIGQYALSNDIAQNISTIQQAISNQKVIENTPERVGEIDGQIFTGGEAYFLQELLNKVQNSDAANTFFTQLRNEINTEILQKIENKEQLNNETQTSFDQEIINNNQQESKDDDAFSKTKKLFNEREGELVDNLTPTEAWDEMRRILSSPEYQQAQTEELGYDTEKGHPDVEIRNYQAELENWRKQLPYPEVDKPTPPQNYEERLKQPKVQYDRYIKEGLTHDEALKTIYKQDDFQSKITPVEQSELPTIEQSSSSSTLKSESLFNIQPQTAPTKQLEQQPFITLQSSQNIKPEISITEQSQTTPIIQTETISNIPKIEPILTTSSFETLEPRSQEQITYETASELPTSDMFVQAEESQDETSEEILANTQKTNTTLDTLTRLLATFIQQASLSEGQQTPPVTIPMPGGQGENSQTVMSDAMLASGSGMIPTIRSKFTYSA